jgi:3-isopropylmalate dehydratase small subunit
MGDCTYCGAEAADIICEECHDIFCKNCIKDGLCPVCGGCCEDEEDPADIII